MFRLHNKNKHAKSGDRVDFKLSRFKALQVPKGWDKLLISVTSVQTGKTLAKSGKALVHNGTCQWTDTLSESIWVPQDDSSKELEDCFFKLVVSMGSARNGILGEAVVNMTGYMSSTAPAPVSLPLKKCNYGTILQVKIHCLTPRTKIRDEEAKVTNFQMEDQDPNYHDADSKSDGSESTLTRSAGSSSSRDLSSISHPGEPESRETSFSASVSHRSYDSREGSIGREKCSPISNLSGDEPSLRGREEAIASQNPLGDPLQSDHSSFNSQIMESGPLSQNSWQDFGTSSLKPAGSSKTLVEASPDTIEELRAEAKMWERNARKLMHDLETLRKEFTDQSRKQENLNMELSAVNAERDGLKKDVERLKLSLEMPTVQQTATEHLAFQDEGLSHIQKELKDELKFQKDSNADLALQLQRSQTSNLELVSVLQELEEIIEKQKTEIENLSALQSKFGDVENFSQVNVEENRNSMIQPQKLHESEKSLQVQVQLLERALEEKNNLKENEGTSNNQSLLEIEREYKAMLCAKGEEIISLRGKLSESLEGRHLAERGSIYEGDASLIREIEVLTEKIQELERDCNELTDENLELLFKLKEATKNSMVVATSFDLPTNELSSKSFTSFESEVSEHNSQTQYLEGKIERKNLRETEDNGNLPTQELENLNMELELKVAEHDKKLADKISEIAKLESKLQSKEAEIGVLRQCQRELEAKVSNLEKDKIKLEEQIEVMQRESDISSKCLNDLQTDLMALRSSLDSLVSANKILERKSSELETGKYELELRISELNEANVQLSESISGLDDQLRYLNYERESNHLELENSKSHAQSLEDEIMSLKIEMDSEKADIMDKLQDMQNHWSKAQEESEHLRKANTKLNATNESLIEECGTLHKSNAELRKQKFELDDHCSLLQAKLRQSERNVAVYSERVETLEKNLSSMMAEISSKEESLTSELEALLDENRRNKEKLLMGEGLLNQVHKEKNLEVENLQQEVEHLTKQLSELHEGKERIASDIVHEVSGLRAEKTNLESSLEESQSKMQWFENELYITRIESESKLQSLMDGIAASKQNQEMLMAEHERVLELLENYRSDEDKFKTMVNGLELKLTVSEYEREQLVEESKHLKVQLQNMAQLHDQVLAFKKELNATKFGTESLEGSLHLTSGECEDLKAEKNSLVGTVSALHNAGLELEEFKNNGAVLEEKLLQMECSRMAKDTQCVQDAELKNELSQIRNANRQYQQKIQLLEEEKDRCWAKAQAFEEELKLMKEGKQKLRVSSSSKTPSISKANSKVTPVHEDMKPSKKNEMVKNSSQHRDTKRRQSLENDKAQKLLKDQQKLYSNICQKEEDDSGNEILDGSPHAVGVDSKSKIQLLEDELAKAIEANNTYKAQIDRFLSQGRNCHAQDPTESTAGDEIVAEGTSGGTKSSLEAELMDIRERYLHMSLKYAEVEAQREDLVMKLKAAKNAKRWFS